MFALLFALAITAAPTPPANPQIDFAGFQQLAGEVAPYRQQHLVGWAEFERLAREPRTLILDARSAAAFAEGHIDGAVNLPLPDFTA